MTRRNDSLNTILTILLLIVITGFYLLYALRTQLYFSQDDFAFLAYFKQYPFPDMVFRFLTFGDPWSFKKIIGYVFLRFLFILFGTNPFPFILFNHLLHTLNVVLVFLVIKILTNSKSKAFFFSLIFSHLYLMYFSNIHEYLVTAFLLSSTYSYLHKNIFLCVMFLIFGLLTKELALLTIPLLLSISYQNKNLKLTKLIPLFIVAIIYLLYQLPFFFSRSQLSLDHPYVTTFHLPTHWHNFRFYFNNKILIVLVLSIPLAFYKRTWPLLFTFLLSIFPALILKNRQEAYYLYLPLSLLVISLATSIPQLKIKSLPIYLLLFYLLGARKLLPPLVWQNFPNWQKQSIQTVLSKVSNTLAQAPQTTSIDLSTLNLQRDANLLLGSQVIEYFLPASLSAKYHFNYNLETHVLNVKTL